MSRPAITAQTPENPFGTTGLCSFPHCPFIEQLRRENDLLIQKQERLQEKIAAQEAAVSKLQDMLFSRSSEKAPRAKQTEQEAQTGTDCETENGFASEAASGNTSGSGRETGAGKDVQSTKPRRRGGQPGHQGFGRAIPNLPVEEVFHEIPPDEKCCPHCGEPMRDIHLTDGRIPHYRLRSVHKVIKHIRKRAVRRCNCAGPKTVTAPKPPKVIPKGLFNNSFLAYLLISRFLFQIPTQRLAGMLKIQGLDVSAGTLFGLYKQLAPILAPLYALLVETDRQAKLLSR
jgi:transposase